MGLFEALLLISPMVFVVTVVGLYYYFRFGRTVRLGRVTVDGTCVACDSTDLEWGPHKTYTCRACGYEGGEGQAQLARDRFVAAIEKLPPVERQQAAERLLKDAITGLGIAGASARAAARPDLAAHLGTGGWAEHLEEQRGTAVNLQRDVLAGADLIAKARILLGLTEADLDVDVEPKDILGAVIAGAVLNITLGSPDLGSLAGQAERLHEHAVTLLTEHSGS